MLWLMMLPCRIEFLCLSLLHELILSNEFKNYMAIFQPHQCSLSVPIVDVSSDSLWQ
jgi:hypothetical protein